VAESELLPLLLLPLLLLPLLLLPLLLLPLPLWRAISCRLLPAGLMCCRLMLVLSLPPKQHSMAGPWGC
jgi:hypothetical protein